MGDRYAELIGTPFAYGGRGPHVYDCYGLLRYLYAQDGMDIPDYISPSDGARISAMMVGELRLWNKVEGPAPGRTALFKVPGNLHVGYCMGEGLFIHTWEASGGVTIERLKDWDQRVMGYYEYAGEQRED